MKTPTRIPSGGTWLYVEVPPFTTDEELQTHLYERAGMDVSVDRIDVREGDPTAKHWRGIVSLLPCHFHQALNCLMDGRNLEFPIYFLPFPKQQKSEAIREPIRQEATT